MHDKTAGSRFSRESHLGDARTGREGLPRFKPEAIHNVQNAGGEQIGDQFRKDKNAGWCLFGRFQHYVTRGQCRSDFPDRHQDRKIPRNDLTDNTQRLVKMVGNSGRVDLRNGTFLCAHTASAKYRK